MTRKTNLSPVPDAPPGGLDVAELRRTLAPAAPAPLQAVETSARPQVVAEARNRLRAAQKALPEVQQHAADMAALIERCEHAVDRERQAEADLRRLEEATQAPVRAWLEQGAHGEPPPLPADQRDALCALQRALADAQTAAITVRNRLPSLHDGLAQAQALVGRSESEIRQAALAVIAAEFDELLERWVSASKAAIEAEHELHALVEFLSGRRYGEISQFNGADWNHTTDELTARVIRARLVAPVRMRIESEEAAARAPFIHQFRLQLDRLLAGEEE